MALVFDRPVDPPEEEDIGDLFYRARLSQYRFAVFIPQRFTQVLAPVAATQLRTGREMKGGDIVRPELLDHTDDTTAQSSQYRRDRDHGRDPDHEHSEKAAELVRADRAQRQNYSFGRYVCFHLSVLISLCSGRLSDRAAMPYMPDRCPLSSRSRPRRAMRAEHRRS